LSIQWSFHAVPKSQFLTWIQYIAEHASKIGFRQRQQLVSLGPLALISLFRLICFFVEQARLEFRATLRNWYQMIFADVSNSDRFDLLQFKQHIDQLLLGIDRFCPAPVSSDHAQ